MAIDFFVMPFSRYLSGAFITPSMRVAWSAGVPYTLLGATTRQIPPDEPFGGPDAEARRRAFLAPDMLPADLARYPKVVASALWEEASEAEPRFHRVDPVSYGALLEENRNRLVERTTSGIFGLRKRHTTPRSHLGCALFLPVQFEEPFVTEHVFEGWLAGSIVTALEELKDSSGNSASDSARATLREALEDGSAARLPVIVDQ